MKRHEERPAAGAGQPVRWEEQKRRLQDVEPVAETGRIYVRNLAYSVTEDDLRQLFVEHGLWRAGRVQGFRCQLREYGSV